MKSKTQQAINRCIHIFLTRNKYYGNSFADTEYSIVAIPCSVKVLVRMEDKMRRLMRLWDIDNYRKDNIPKIIDTLLDLANYAILDIMVIVAEVLNKPFNEACPNVDAEFRGHWKRLHNFNVFPTDGEKAFDDLMKAWNDLGTKNGSPTDALIQIAGNALTLAILTAGDQFDYYFNLSREDTE